MIRRNTWILIVLLAALVGFSFYLKNRKTTEAAAVTPTAAAGSVQLFAPAEGTPTDIKMADDAGQSVELARNETGLWVLKAPANAAADQAAAEAAATQIGSLRVLSSVQLGLDAVGLTKPAYTLSITFSTGKTHKLAVGAVTPIQDGYYTSLDGGPVRIVDKQGIDALIPLLTQPPFAATLTPAVPPSASPAPETPTSEATTATASGSETPGAASSTATTPANTPTP